MGEIQRYNQGFGGFGPLEKCNTGKLVFYLDHVNRMVWERAKRHELEAQVDALEVRVAGTRAQLVESQKISKEKSERLQEVSEIAERWENRYNGEKVAFEQRIQELHNYYDSEVAKLNSFYAAALNKATRHTDKMTSAVILLVVISAGLYLARLLHW